MATREEIWNTIKMADEGAERIMNAWPGPIGAQAGIAGQIGAQSYQQQSQQAAGPSCAHLIVGYVRQALGSGRERGWWQCVECDAKFVPSGTGPATNTKY